MADEEALLVARAVAGLPRDYQEVIRLRHWDDLTFDQIATRMGALARGRAKALVSGDRMPGVDWENRRS